MTRPKDLIYAVDERPPWPRLAFLGAQDAVLMSVYLVLIVIVFRHAKASDAATLHALGLGMIALAISTVLQGLWKGPVGSGYLAPSGILLLWLADFLTGVYLDRMEARSEGQNAEIRLMFPADPERRAGAAPRVRAAASTGAV